MMNDDSKKLDGVDEAPVAEEAPVDGAELFRQALASVSDRMMHTSNLPPLKDVASTSEIKKATNLSKMSKRKQIMLKVTDTEGKEHERVVTDNDLHMFFAGAISDCLEQCFNAFDAMKERFAAGVEPMKIVQAAALICSREVGQCIYTLSGESKLTTQQKHVLAFLNEVADKFDSIDGMSAEDEETQILVVKLVSEYVYALGHMAYAGTMPKRRLRIINDYRNGRNASYMKPLPNWSNPIVNLHRNLFPYKHGIGAADEGQGQENPQESN